MFHVENKQLLGGCHTSTNFRSAEVYVHTGWCQMSSTCPKSGTEGGKAVRWTECSARLPGELGNLMFS